MFVIIFDILLHTLLIVVYAAALWVISFPIRKSYNEEKKKIYVKEFAAMPKLCLIILWLQNINENKPLEKTGFKRELNNSVAIITLNLVRSLVANYVNCFQDFSFIDIALLVLKMIKPKMVISIKKKPN